eukprot:scaffold207435_cov32-Tisochrysis_lutea.AAC.1
MVACAHVEGPKQFRGYDCKHTPPPLRTKSAMLDDVEGRGESNQTDEESRSNDSEVSSGTDRLPLMRGGEIVEQLPQGGHIPYALDAMRTLSAAELRL